MEDIDRLKDLSRQEFRDSFGTTEKKLEIPQKVKKEISREMLELEEEKHIEENELTFGHALLIMAQRSRSMREKREDPELRMRLSKKD